MWIGIDIGGTKIESFILSEFGEQSYKVVSRHRLPTDRDLGYEHIISQICLSVQEAIKAAKASKIDIKALGLAMPGSVDPLTQKMLQGNTGVLIGKDVAGDTKRALNFEGPIILENDANCFALAESRFGAGKNLSTKAPLVLGVILGTGVGGGIVLGDQIMSGRNGAAGEIGHIEIHENGRDCYCGRIGCAEQYLAGSSLEKYFFEQHSEKVSSKEIFLRAEQKEAPFIEILQSYKSDLAKTLGQAVNLINPDLIVCGGGVSEQLQIYEGLESELSKHLLVKEALPLVKKNELGDSCGGIGAAYLAALNSED